MKPIRSASSPQARVAFTPTSKKAGKATVVVKRLKKGKYKVSAVYSGDKNVTTSTGKTTVKVK